MALSGAWDIAGAQTAAEPQSSGSSRDTLSERVSALEARVAQLERRLAAQDDLQEAGVGQKPGGPWRSLRRGMSTSAVRDQLGRPSRKNEQLMSETWWYLGAKGAGWVQFDEKGRLESWGEP